jgi:hypothetical protein
MVQRSIALRLFTSTSGTLACSPSKARTFPKMWYSKLVQPFPPRPIRGYGLAQCNHPLLISLEINRLVTDG